MKITSATISAMPRPMPEGMCDPMPKVTVTYEDNSSEDLFEYFPDEITFSEKEFVGLTRVKAISLRHSKDVKFLES